VAAILEHGGYQVLKAPGPAEALELAARTDAPIDLLLADVVMPQMSGPEMAGRFRTIHPESRLLFIAGYGNSPQVRAKVLDAGHQLLLKPFLPVTLLRKVDEVLSGAAMVA
jgi:CheY-like chemotaxis protein